MSEVEKSANGRSCYLLVIRCWILGFFLSTSVNIFLLSHNKILFLLPLLSPHIQSEDADAGGGFREGRQRLMASPWRAMKSLSRGSGWKQEPLLVQRKAQNIFFLGVPIFGSI